MPVPTRILAGATVLLQAMANVRGAYPEEAMVRHGAVHETFAGPVPQYGTLARSEEVVEVEFVALTDAQIAVVHAMLRGDHGDTFTVEAPRETFTGALLPGREGASFELYRSAPGATLARAILRFVRV